MATIAEKPATGETTQYVVNVARVSNFEGSITLHIKKGIVGIVAEDDDFIIDDECKKVRYTKRALVAQLCEVSDDFATYTSVMNGVPVNMLGLLLRDADLTIQRTFYAENDIIPATDYSDEKEATHDVFTTKILDVKFSAKMQMQLDKVAEKAFEMSLAKAFE